MTIFFPKKSIILRKKTFHLDFFNNFGQKRCFSANNAVLWCSLKGPTLLALAMDPLNTLETQYCLRQGGTRPNVRVTEFDF